MSDRRRVPASFRDPSGFVFEENGVLFRQVNVSYAADFNLLNDSGLYEELVSEGLLIPHEVCSGDQHVHGPGAHAILKPEPVRTLSYPYEWCFSEFKDAALATLEIQKRSLRKGMVLKDASAYNIQFHRGKPLLIDTLSFALYEEGKPWIAYGQFCRHFLAPLLMMSKADARLSALLRAHIDGIPLDLASRLLPWSSWLSLWTLVHLHLHAKAQRRYATPGKTPQRTVAKHAMTGLIDSLESLVRGLKWRPVGTEWADYYQQTNYDADAMAAKKRLVAELLDDVSPAPNVVWDLGANTGEFSRLASDRGIHTVAWDLDPAAVEQAYLQARGRNDPWLMPLVQDLANPSPNLGWAQKERDSFADRGPADVVMALALAHHLAIGNNVPLRDIAEFLADLGDWLIVEFVPKEDSQVQRLLASREDLFDDYCAEGFEAAFEGAFDRVRRESIPGTARSLYLYRRSGPTR